MKSFITFLFIFFIGYWIYSIFSPKYKLWIYADSGTISRFYMGKEKSDEKCQYNALKYISQQNFQERKYYYVCGHNCKKSEASCSSMFTSRVFDKNNNELKKQSTRVKYYLDEMKKLYRSNYFGIWAKIRFYCYSKMDLYGFLNDQSAINWFSKYIGFQILLSRYQYETLDLELNNDLGPAVFKARLLNRILETT